MDYEWGKKLIKGHSTTNPVIKGLEIELVKPSRFWKPWRFFAIGKFKMEGDENQQLMKAIFHNVMSGSKDCKYAWVRWLRLLLPVGSIKTLIYSKY